MKNTSNVNKLQRQVNPIKNVEPKNCSIITNNLYKYKNKSPIK
jgi:hypothetical protein